MITDPFFEKERTSMVNEQLIPRGIQDPRVLKVMSKIPRERFVLTEEKNLAYRDGPLPIGQMQTISQPYIVAYMTEFLDLSEQHRVLEIGTGSGYQAAVLASLVSSLFTMEIVEELASRSRHILDHLGFKNIHFRVGNGFEGWAEEAPFDRIMLTAAPEIVPQILFDQLAPKGKLLAPVGVYSQSLVLYEKDEDGRLSSRELLWVRFVPMTGDPRGPLTDSTP